MFINFFAFGKDTAKAFKQFHSNKVLVFTLLFLTSSVHAQNSAYDILVDGVCQDLKSFLADTDNVNSISAGIGNWGLDVLKFKDEIDEKYSIAAGEIVESIKKDNPTATDKEVLTEYITTFSFSIIDDCPEFYSVILESTKSKYPEKNSYLELLLSEIQDCFKANGGKSYSELKVLVDDKMAELLIKNRVLVGELYEDGIAGMDVINDSIYYLIHHSKDYLKTVLFMGIDMLVDAYLD